MCVCVHAGGGGGMSQVDKNWSRWKALLLELSCVLHQYIIARAGLWIVCIIIDIIIIIILLLGLSCGWPCPTPLFHLMHATMWRPHSQYSSSATGSGEIVLETWLMCVQMFSGICEGTLSVVVGSEIIYVGSLR